MARDLEIQRFLLRCNVQTKTFTAIVQKEGDGWVSLCPELDIASQGDSIESARESLKEAVQLFLEAASPKEIEQRLATETHLCPLEVSFG